MGSSNTGFTAWNEKMNVYDPEEVKLESPMTLYMVYRYATSFISNQFIGNTIGQKGSAIYNRQGSIIIIEQNDFDMNGPVYSLSSNSTNMPYYKYLSAKSRSPFFHEPLYIAEFTDEFLYMEMGAKSYANGGLIDLPQL